MSAFRAILAVVLCGAVVQPTRAGEPVESPIPPVERPALVGGYSCVSEFTLTWTEPFSETIRGTSEGDITIESSGEGDLRLAWSTVPDCSFEARRVGRGGIELAQNQSCRRESDDTEITVTLKRGTGRLVETSLGLELWWEITGTAAGVAVSGRSSERTTCEKRS